MIQRALPLLVFGTVLLTAPPAAAERPPVVLMDHDRMPFGAQIMMAG